MSTRSYPLFPDAPLFRSCPGDANGNPSSVGPEAACQKKGAKLPVMLREQAEIAVGPARAAALGQRAGDGIIGLFLQFAVGTAVIDPQPQGLVQPQRRAQFELAPKPGDRKSTV